MQKMIVTWCLALLVCLGLTVPALAASDEAVAAADTLYELGLFSGTGTNADGSPVYELDRTPNRAEAVTLLVRLLGKETEVTAKGYYVPFSDVADWALPYVGYAYSASLTSGVSNNSFGSSDTVSAAQYLTFVLRALGYADGTDFQWATAWELTDQLGITSGQFNASSTFTRGDAVIVSVNALEVTLKGSTKTLLETIEENLAADPLDVTVDNAGKTFSGTGEAYGNREQQLDGARATVEVISSTEAVFTLEHPFLLADASNYVVTIVKRTGHPMKNTRHLFSFSYFKPNDEYSADGYLYYTDWANMDMNTQVEDMSGVVFSDTSAADYKVSWRAVLPEDCAFNFDLLGPGEYEIECTVGTFLGGGVDE